MSAEIILEKRKTSLSLEIALLGCFGSAMDRNTLRLSDSIRTSQKKSYIVVEHATFNILKHIEKGLVRKVT